MVASPVGCTPWIPDRLTGIDAEGPYGVSPACWRFGRLFSNRSSKPSSSGVTVRYPRWKTGDEMLLVAVVERSVVDNPG